MSSDHNWSEKAKIFLKRVGIRMPRSNDPLFYLGILSIVLFGLACFVPSFFEEGFFLASVGSSAGGTQSQNLTRNPEEVSLIDNMFLGQIDISLLESPDLVMVQRTAVKAVSSPAILSPKVLGSVISSGAEPEIREDIIEYIVELDDTLSSIADKFNLSLNTLLWANELTRDSLLKPGQKLIILPVSGVIHHVKPGDTVNDIARKYKAKAEDIIAFNELEDASDIFIGDILIAPNGVVPAPVVSSKGVVWAPLPNSYFICPISQPCRITQGLHWYNAVDFSHGQCEEPIYAAAGGTVLKVRTTTSRSRWALGGGGNYVTILHPNGVVTSYGHLAKILVNPGERVSQGQIIALLGGEPGSPGAGRSTGCHLHFGVRGSRNPFAQ